MRVLVWIVEETWRTTVSAAAALLPDDAEITLLHVSESDAEVVARGARYALLGRPGRPSAVSLDTISEESARELLADAQTALGRDAVLAARFGRVEQQVAAAADSMDVLVLARDEDRAHRGPRSIGPTARHVLEHVTCAVLVVWPDAQSSNASE